MKIKLNHVIKRQSRGRIYYYFRHGVDSRGHGGKLTPLPGAPGTHQFQSVYELLLRLHAPAVIARQPRRAAIQNQIQGMAECHAIDARGL